MTTTSPSTGSTKISQLGAASAFDGTEQFPLTQSGVTKAGTLKQAAAFALSQLESFNITSAPYGGVIDGSTDNTAAINAAIAAANSAGAGKVVIPTGSSARCVVASTVTLKPNVFIELQGATVYFTGGAKSCFQFVGTSEAQSLNGGLIGVGTVQSSASGSGYGVRLRNFANFVIASGVIFTGWARAVKTDWGQGLCVSGVSGAVTFALNTRAIETGGNDTLPVGISAGIRGGPGTAFMDFVYIEPGVSFSQNQIDVNDMGSIQSDGVFSIVGATFYESGSSPVSGKSNFVRIANRKGFRWHSNNVESPNDNRRAVTITNVTADGATLQPCFGYDIGGGGNLLMTGSGAIGIDVVRGQGKIAGANFEFSATNQPIKLEDSVVASEVGTNSYLIYPDTTGFVGPILISSPAAGHRTPGGPVQLTDAASVASDAAAGDYFLLTATASRTIAAPSNPSDGKQITFDIYNNSGGAMTTTWNAVFLTAGWTDPANTKRRTISFRYTNASSKWVTVAAASADM